jgi:PIN domain nuclease of toxin-antitoxin system
VRFLLDTSYLYNLAATEALFSEREEALLDVADAEFFVSAVSIWEMRIKFGAQFRSGARKSPYDPRTVLELLEDEDISFLPLTIAHAAQALEVPLRHKDPFDELLLAQAQAEGLKLLTVDRLLARHPLAMTV